MSAARNKYKSFYGLHRLHPYRNFSKITYDRMTSYITRINLKKIRTAQPE